MKYENGSKWVFWAVGTIVTALFFLANSVIANDSSSRNRDDELREKIACSCEKQNETNQQILVALAEIKGDIKTMKRENATR